MADSATGNDPNRASGDRWSVPRPAYISTLRESVSLRMAVGTAVVVGLGLAIIAVSFAPFFPDPDDSWLTFGVREIGAGLLTVAIVNVVLQVFIERNRQQLTRGLEDFLKDDVTADLHQIRSEIGGQTEALLQGSSTLAALGSRGVHQVYSSRGEATEALRRDIEARGVERIRIMGISLNDFLRSDQKESLHAVWRVVTSYVRGERAPDRDLDIRVLIIDPNCFGGLLRSYGEAREDDQLAGRLDEDVKATARRLSDLVDEARSRAVSGDGDGAGRVTFDFRLYRLAPTLFICATDKVSFVQPYYFWSRRQFDVTMPMMRLEGNQLHAAMADHFDLVWDTASVDGQAWMDANQVGLEKGALETGTVNVFTSSTSGYDRMCWLIDHASERVWVQGISLKSFFEPGKLAAALRRAMRKDDIDVRCATARP
jgi:hypothetical protein